MCGIVGFITDESKGGEDARSKFLRQGLIVDTLRGDDSTGAYGVGHGTLFKDKEDLGAMWCKSTDEGYDFVNSDNYMASFWDVSSYRACVGHNRAATMGDSGTSGAHPFVVGPITLVHNGTLTSTGSLPIPMYQIDGVNVDSHAVAHNLAEHPVEEVIKGLHGAFVLVWHDARDNSMNIVRNNKRPFHMAQSSEQDTIFFASEGPMLDFLGKRLELKLGPIYFPREGQHLKWLPNTELTAPQVKDLDLHSEWSQCSNGYNDYSGYSAYGSSDDDWKNAGARSGGNVIPFNAPKGDKVFLGGRKKEIPMLIQEEMLKYDLVVEDRLAFSPRVSCSIHVANKRFNVFGRLEGKYNAVVFGLTESTASHMNRTWEVRPLAVYHKLSSPLPTIICKLTSTVGPKPNPGFSTTGTLLRQDGTVIGYEKDDRGQEMKYHGAFGAKYGKIEWLTLVATGCGFCGKPIAIQDHADIRWINNGAVPLCVYCDDDAYGALTFEDDIPFEKE